MLVGKPFATSFPLLAMLLLLTLFQSGRAWGGDSNGLLNLNDRSISELFGAYGFVFGQSQSLRKISNEFPDLAVRAKIAEMKFDKKYESPMARISKVLIGSIGVDVFRQLQSSLRSQVIAQMNAVEFSHQFGEAFLKEMENRLAGNFDRNIERTPLTLPECNSTASVRPVW